MNGHAADPAKVFLPLNHPAPPRHPPKPLEPRRKELEGTPAGRPAPFPAEPFLRAVEAVVEQEGSEALGSMQWALLRRPRLRSLLDGAASRGSDGLQNLLRKRYPAVVPGDAEGCLVAIRSHLRALLRERSPRPGRRSRRRQRRGRWARRALAALMHRGNCYSMADQPRALDRSRIGEAPLTLFSGAEMTALEQALRGVMGME